MTQELTDILDNLDDEVVILDGFDDCVVGTTTNLARKEVLVYSVTRIVSKLIDTDDMSFDEALEHFYFNIEGAYLGVYSPVFMYNELNQMEM